MKKLLIALLLLSVLGMPSGAQSPVPTAGDGSAIKSYKRTLLSLCVRDSLKFKGTMRTWLLYEPEQLSPERPLLICLHGYGGAAERGKKQLVDLAQKMGFVLCFPQGLKDPKGKPSWNVGYPSQKGWKQDDVAFLERLTRHLQKKYALDPRNAFLAGMSNGGEMCYLMARRKPDLFAGILSIAGLTLECMKPLRYNHPVPFLELHGTIDTVSRWEGDPENRHGWGEYLGVPAAVSYVVAANECVSYQKTEVADDVILHRYMGGKKARKGKGHACEVWFYEVVGGRHSWSDDFLDTYGQMGAFIEHFLYKN